MSISVCTRIKRELKQQKIEFDQRKEALRIGYESNYSKYEGQSNIK